MTQQNGSIPTPNFETYSMDTPLRADFDMVPKLMAAYCTFAGLKAQRQNQVERKLVEGDVAFVDNRRVLHGRRAFDASLGLRHIRTSYGERGVAVVDSDD